ncbi:acyl-CoA dehydrogenase family protein, partial [Thermobrachium celere]
MDFSLTREQQLAKEMFEKFVENEVRPIAAEIDETERF